MFPAVRVLVHLFYKLEVLFFLLMTVSISEVSKYNQYNRMVIRKCRKDVLGEEEPLSIGIEEPDLPFFPTTVAKARKV